MKTTPEDHVEITDLLARYCLTLDLEDVDAWVDLFTPDAVYEVYGRKFEGRESLRRFIARTPPGLHLGGPVAIEMVTPDRAVTRQNLLFIPRAGGASRSAFYTDVLVRTDAGWRIANRRCQFIVADGLADRPDE